MHSYFDEQGVLLTERGLAVAGQFYALRDMRGVQVQTVEKDKRLPLTLSLVGLVSLGAGIRIGSPAAIVAGVMLAAVGWINWRVQDAMHYVLVDMSGGPREALGSVDPEFAERVAQAVRAAIESREPAA
jgi:hypothetical protein